MSRTSFRSIGFILSVVLGGAAGCNRPLALSKPDGAAVAAHGGSTAEALDAATAVVDGGTSIGDGPRDVAIAVDVVAAIDASTGATEVADARLDGSDGSPDAAPVHHGALAVAIGDAHACALRDDHTVKCWGSGVSATDHGPSQAAVAIAAGGPDTCAILDDGRVTCWASASGEAWSDASFSADFGPNRRAVSLAMSHRSWACAVLDDGTARCWSRPPLASMIRTLVPSANAAIRQLLLGWANETIALYDDGTIGEGNQLALPDPGRLIPGRAATTLANVRGGLGWCATLVGGGVYCWGIGVQDPTNGATLTAMAMTETFSCGLRPNGAVSCWNVGCDDGDYWCKPQQNEDKSYDVAFSQSATSLAMGTEGTSAACALLADGSVMCWSVQSTCLDLDGVTCEGIVGASVEVVNTDAGLKYGAWRAIDLDSPP